MSNTISKADFLSVLDDTFSVGKTFAFTPTGDSMKPMLNGTTDTVLLSQKPQKLKKYDVVFYRRKKDDALILHRIVKVCGDMYTMSGDSQYYFDKDIHYDDIFAVMVSFTHNNKRYLCTDFLYKCYSRIILIKKYTRIFFSKLYHRIIK